MGTWRLPLVTRWLRLGLPCVVTLVLLAFPAVATAAQPVINDVTFDGSATAVNVNIDCLTTGQTTYEATVSYYHGAKLGSATSTGQPLLVDCAGDVTDRYLQVDVQVTNADGGDTMTVDNAPDTVPHISSIDMNTDHGFGGAGEEVWIYGSGFGLFHDQSDVFFMPGGIKPTILDWGPDLITLKVPNGAKDGSVHVTTVLGSSNDFPFDVTDNVTGTVIDGHGSAYGNALFDARVELKDKGSGAVLETAYTNEMGYFAIAHELEQDKAYRLTVTLQTEDKKLILKDNGTTVSFSRDFTWTSATMFPMTINCRKTAEIDDASVDKGHLDNDGALWYYLEINRKVAQLATRDLPWTITVNTYLPGQSCSYKTGTKTIELSARKCNDDSSDGAPPPWDFKKNRESHEFGHALMHYAMSGADVAGPDVRNHAGYVNSTTGDSLSEGFAEFWAMYVDTIAGITVWPDQYDGWGHLATLDRRMAWSPMDTANPSAAPADESDEEFAAAGLLYRLWFLLGQDTPALNKIVDALPVGGTLTDFYEALSAGSPAYAAQIKDYFTQHGFFDDTDGDWTYDAGEPIGAGNGAACKMGYGSPLTVVDLAPRLTRREHPEDPNSYVGVDLKGVSSADAESWVTVAVSHPDDPLADYSEKTLVTGSKGLVYAYLDGAGSTGTVTVKGPDGQQSADKLTFTYADWTTARTKVADGAALTGTFAVDTVTVGTPAGPKTLRVGQAATFSGTLTPHHAAGTYPVLIFKYLQVGKKWKAKGSVKAKAADSGDISKYSAKIKLTVKGKWRLRAKAIADTEHVATWSKGYKVVTVR